MNTWNSVFSGRKYPWKCSDHHIGPVDGPLGLGNQGCGGKAPDPGRADAPIDLAHGDPRAMMSFDARPTPRRSSKALREITACDRDRGDELIVSAHRGCELGDRWGRGDHGTKRRMMFERMNGTSGHA